MTVMMSIKQPFGSVTASTAYCLRIAMNGGGPTENTERAKCLIILELFKEIQI